MKTFKHINAASLEEARSLLVQNDGARVIAGGTDLIGTMKGNIHPSYPELLINLKSIPNLAGIREQEGCLTIGAMTKLHEIASDPRVQEKFTALAEAASMVATPQIRNMATLGGNVCQETRCWYYRHPENQFHCLRKGGEICGALVGENRYHSIMGAMRMQSTPCSTHCPAGTDIPEYLESIRAGDLDNAAGILLKSNPFPAVTGRVCPHYCQEGCNRGAFDQAVSIREVERTLGDYVLDHSERFFHAPEHETGKHVAVVGSGPGGLGAAYFLRLAGHRVTMFERLEKPGGMLTYTIPSYRLPSEVVERSIECLTRMGIEIRCGVSVGLDPAFDELQREYDGVFLATGAWKLPTIDVEGEEAAIHALEFLKDIREGLREAPGREVVIIGGGNVAVDAAISAKRLGAQSVTMICLEQRAEMPAAEAEIQQALDEGIKLLNGWGPKHVKALEGRVQGVELKRCISVFDVDGRFAPSYDETQTREIHAEAVILAVSQGAETTGLPEELLADGRVRVDSRTGKTGLPHVYAGGDVVRVANVIDAIAAGKNAASAMHADLSGEVIQPKGDARFHDFHPGSLEFIETVTVPFKPIEERRIDLEDSASLPQAMMEIEANRCLNCGCVAVSPSDTGAALIALDAVIVTTQREIPAEAFFACRECSSTVLEAGELVKEIRIPTPAEGSRSAYRKFRMRESIDFPIVSAAVRVDVSAGAIADSRVVLGAVAPIPLRASATETYLQGRKVKEVAGDLPAGDGKIEWLDLPGAQAAGLAVEGAVELKENAYKIQLTRAYVRRAILACLQD